jgi:peptide/nickel transport system permease protein
MGDVFFHLDFGTSYYNSTPIINEILARLPRTITIAGFGCLITLLLGIPLGILAAVNQNGIADRVCMVVSMVGVALPEFCVAMLLVTIFSSWLGLLPSHGVKEWTCYIMPVIAVGLNSMAGLARNCRNCTLESIRSDYVTTARAKGVKEWKVILCHVLPNSLIPVVTSIGTSFANMMGGAIVIENVFSIPGMGQYIVTAINSRDYNVIQGSVIVLAILFSIIILLIDLVYAFIDPRIKAQYLGSGRRKKTT